jgi:glycosyltransferase involved in cell wall biosynthesis
MLRRILLLITDLEIGGTPTVVHELAIRLRDPGRVEVEVACLSPRGPVADQLQAAGVTVTPLNARGIGSLPITLFRLVRLIHRGEFDTVFSFLVHANLMATLASAFCPGVRFLQSIQTTQPNPRWHWRVQRMIHVVADAVVVPSPSAARAAREWANVPAQRVVVIPNAVDVASFDEIAANRRIPAEPYQIGFIGRLDPIKRVEDLVESMKGWRSSKGHLHIFGEGPERTHIEQQIERLGLAEQVTLHGAISRPHEALASMDVLVLPSDAEGFGLVLIEAMAAGVPVVATRVPGILDVVDNQMTGLLMPRRSPQAIQEAVTVLCTDTKRRASLVTAARKEVRRRFGWEGTVRQYKGILRIIQDIAACRT